ncbi:hypothetical protein ES332_A12G096700v1 [Gossypium tomentosum]|uniref:Uncharacterized protein n=1 Tax=Gossypium tomentosum TaxID=34277 RepID=A0A5D2MUR3_GOSTO|nr:hypothetical protein ES332_A12G096700v1 [Gossypium tomentosum]
MAANGTGLPMARKPLAKIVTEDKQGNGMCHDDSAKGIKAQTIDELHSLQKKRSAPTTPLEGNQGAFASLPDDERRRQQLQSISASLASLTRGAGPKVVRGDPAAKSSQAVEHVAHRHHHHVEAPTISVSDDSSLKFTHVLYNLAPAELYEQAIKYEKGSLLRRQVH